MAPLIEAAAKTGDVVNACEDVGIPLGHYLRARRTDPAFAVACVELDLIARHAASVKLEAAAARGELNAGKLKLWLTVLDSIRIDEGQAPAVVPAGDADGWPVWLSAIVAGWRAGSFTVPFNVTVQDADGVTWSLGRLVDVRGYGKAFAGPCHDCLVGMRPREPIGPTRQHTQPMDVVIRSERASLCPNIPLPGGWPVGIPVIFGEVYDGDSLMRRRRLWDDRHAEVDEGEVLDDAEDADGEGTAADA